MNDMTGMHAAEQPPARGDISFTGTWQEFLPIALTNLLLTVVTLGIYRFWAKARERRYLWSRTHFVDDSLEWSGTGLEMFLGALIVTAILLPAFLFIGFGFQALVLRGQVGLAMGLLTAIYAGFFYLYHVGKFRALRYRLSRTWWHGIRGGSDDAGWGYGWSGLWKMAAGSAVIGLLIPWALTQLWNERFNKMSFGPHRFLAYADENGLMGRWLLIYLAPVVGAVSAFAIFAFGAFISGPVDEGSATAIGFAFLGVFAFYAAFLLFSLGFYALYYRKVAAATSVGGMRFQFTARTKDWLKLILGNIGLVIVTLGLGLVFIGYRNWSFMVAHLEASGAIEFDQLTQSTTRAPGDAEGLAEAFDIGAI